MTLEEKNNRKARAMAGGYTIAEYEFQKILKKEKIPHNYMGTIKDRSVDFEVDGIPVQVKGNFSGKRFQIKTKHHKKMGGGVYVFYFDTAPMDKKWRWIEWQEVEKFGGWLGGETTNLKVDKIIEEGKDLHSLIERLKSKIYLLERSKDPRETRLIKG